MGLFKRKEPQGAPCPRCHQLVSERDGLTCPMCGWDLRDAYQGPAADPAQRRTPDQSGAPTA
jgi:hypothetical protein